MSSQICHWHSKLRHIAWHLQEKNCRIIGRRNVAICAIFGHGHAKFKTPTLPSTGFIQATSAKMAPGKSSSLRPEIPVDTPAWAADQCHHTDANSRQSAQPRQA